MTRQSPELEEAIGRWEVQLRKGALEFVILVKLREREQYGFELISRRRAARVARCAGGHALSLYCCAWRGRAVASCLAEGDGGAAQYYALIRAGRDLIDAMVPA